MGCDIHWTIEIKHNDKWIGYLSSLGNDSKAAERWYAFFGEVAAGVRGGDSETALPLRGLPEDISDLTRYAIECDSWDHSQSWATIEEYVDAYNRAVDKYKHVNYGDLPVSCGGLFGLSYWPFYEDHDDVRIVFAFDN